MEIEGAKYSYSNENAVLGIFLEQKNETADFFSLSIHDNADEKIYNAIYEHIENHLIKYDAILQRFAIYLINRENAVENIKALLNKHFLQ